MSLQFDLFWPERHESKSVMIAWKVCGVLSCVFYLANALWLTVVASRHCGYFRGATYDYGESLLAHFTKDGGTPLCYRHNPRIIASVVFVWLGFVSVVPRSVLPMRLATYIADMYCSCVLLFLSIDHIENGPGFKSKHARDRDDAARLAEAGMSSDPEKEAEVDANAPPHQQSIDEAATNAPVAASTPVGGR